MILLLYTPILNINFIIHYKLINYTVFPLTIAWGDY